MGSVNRGALKAIVYADIFDFPLTKQECETYAIRGKKGHLYSVSSSLVEEKDGYFFLKGREVIIPLRKGRAESSAKKRVLAQTIANYFSRIPTVLLVGISGGVASWNAAEEDDIDIFMIVSPGGLWPTRLLSLFLLNFLGRRRGKDDKRVKDKICLNMIVDLNHIAFSKQQRNVYTAHEIVNLIPLFSRGKIYQDFIRVNSWIFTYLPNARGKIASYSFASLQDRMSFLKKLLLFPLVVQLSAFLQRVYMGKAAQSSYIVDGVVGFYPKHFQGNILAIYEQKLHNMGIDI